MKIIDNGLLSVEKQLATQLDMERILTRRKQSVMQEDKDSLRRFEAGLAGEELVVDYLKMYGRKHWVVLRNIWLSNFGNCECDVVLITSVGVHTFEVKNYVGEFIYENSKCTLENQNIKHNCVSQATKAYATMREICGKFSRRIQVSGSLVFAGTDNTVEIRSPIDDLQVVPLNQLRKYIQRIAQAEDNSRYGQPIDVQGLLHYLKTFAIPNPYTPVPLSVDEMSQLRTGICCASCGNFDVDIGRQYVTCPCGLDEPRDEAIIRTICEYGVLTYDRDMGRQELLAFFGGDISLDILRKTADKYFDVLYKHRRVWYKNLQKAYDKISNLFNFELPKIWNVSQSEYLVIKKEK